MEQSKKDIALGKFLSFILRHHPDTTGISLDENGWADVDDLLKGMKKTGRTIDKQILEQIVRENNKKRYSFNKDHTKIRANQGHSICVDVELKEEIPPNPLYHGTAERFLENIKKQGICRKTRQYVHLSSDKNTAISVGRRHGKPVILTIDTKSMVKDKIPFYLSENDVWLCEFVAWKYVIKEETRGHRI